MDQSRLLQVGKALGSFFHRMPTMDDRMRCVEETSQRFWRVVGTGEFSFDPKMVKMTGTNLRGRQGCLTEYMLLAWLASFLPDMSAQDMTAIRRLRPWLPEFLLPPFLDALWTSGQLIPCLQAVYDSLKGHGRPRSSPKRDVAAGALRSVRSREKSGSVGAAFGKGYWTPKKRDTLLGVLVARKPEGVAGGEVIAAAFAKAVESCLTSGSDREGRRYLASFRDLVGSFLATTLARRLEGKDDVPLIAMGLRLGQEAGTERQLKSVHSAGSSLLLLGTVEGQKLDPLRIVLCKGTSGQTAQPPVAILEPLPRSALKALCSHSQSRSQQTWTRNTDGLEAAVLEGVLEEARWILCEADTWLSSRLPAGSGPKTERDGLSSARQRQLDAFVHGRVWAHLPDEELEKERFIPFLAYLFGEPS